MVKQRVAESLTSEWDEKIEEALGKLERVSFHKIITPDDITEICHEVISRVDGTAQLQHITSGQLQKLRKNVKKKVKKSLDPAPIKELSEIEINTQNAKIREDWNGQEWINGNRPFGWAWREKVRWAQKKRGTEKEIIALVYKMKGGWYPPEIFLDSEILAHPRGALALIKAIQKKHAVLMKNEDE